MTTTPSVHAQAYDRIEWNGLPIHYTDKEAYDGFMLTTGKAALDICNSGREKDKYDETVCHVMLDMHAIKGKLTRGIKNISVTIVKSPGGEYALLILVGLSWWRHLLQKACEKLFGPDLAVGRHKKVSKPSCRSAASVVAVLAFHIVRNLAELDQQNTTVHSVSYGRLDDKKSYTGFVSRVAGSLDEWKGGLQ